ncbi:hypothetical protein LCGC14_1385000 [marine sediment metagenome]|uniref:Uncharacterized protein n=1 Tax=marine sediment metagenome TaxID=412755 RepID=A0A0F9MH30_9ZZZZ
MDLWTVKSLCYDKKRGQLYTLWKDKKGILVVDSCGELKEYAISYSQGRDRVYEEIRIGDWYQEQNTKGDTTCSVSALEFLVGRFKTILFDKGYDTGHLNLLSYIREFWGEFVDDE